MGLSMQKATTVQRRPQSKTKAKIGIQLWLLGGGTAFGVILLGGMVLYFTGMLDGVAGINTSKVPQGHEDWRAQAQEYRPSIRPHDAPAWTMPVDPLRPPIDPARAPAWKQ